MGAPLAVSITGTHSRGKSVSTLVRADRHPLWRAGYMRPTCRTFGVSAVFQHSPGATELMGLRPVTVCDFGRLPAGARRRHRYATVRRLQTEPVECTMFDAVKLDGIDVAFGFRWFDYPAQALR